MSRGEVTGSMHHNMPPNSSVSYKFFSFLHGLIYPNCILKLTLNMFNGCQKGKTKFESKDVKNVCIFINLCQPSISFLYMQVPFFT